MLIYIKSFNDGKITCTLFNKKKRKNNKQTKKKKRGMWFSS